MNIDALIEKGETLASKAIKSINVGEKKKLFEKAMERFEKAEQLDPENLKIWLKKAGILKTKPEYFGEKYCYVNGEKHFYRDVAIYVLDCTLAALSLYSLKSEAEKFMRCVLNGEIEEYLRELDFEMVKKRSNVYSTILDILLPVSYLTGFLAVALMF
ncbi:MAG: hypothetical protein B6U95_07300 [Thermofilum sp. ex4484_82]|nr:MAG: hypothetical protein B6U95_07300 [Thermofilum sp. ex4484_82]OYT37203.1 MAG: hypothetical protein B6U96_07295 [Archaeoglobales archaeon ex4484_92]